MRWLVAVTVLGGLCVGCGSKKAPAVAVPDAPSPPEQPVAPPPPPEPVVEEPAEPEPPANNADFQVQLSLADGGNVSGHVVRVERGIDRYAENGWTDDASDLVVTLESDSDMVDAKWDDIKSISIRMKARGDIDCMYESDFSPWMYMCTMPTTSSAVMNDGKTWRVSGRHRWKFTFDDGTSKEFYVYKIPVREQDSASMGMDQTENYDLYARLQADLMNLVKADTVTSIKISK